MHTVPALGAVAQFELGSASKMFSDNVCELAEFVQHRSQHVMRMLGGLEVLPNNKLPDDVPRRWQAVQSFPLYIILLLT